VTVTYSLAPSARREKTLHLLAQIVGRQARGVDQDGGAAPQRAEQVKLPRDAVGRVVVGGERMAAAGFGIAPLKRHRLAVEIKQVGLDPSVAASRSYSATRPSAEKSRFRASVPSAMERSGGGPSRRRGRQAEGKVVDGLEPEILERVDRGGAARTGRAGDEDHPRRRGRDRSDRLRSRRSFTPRACAHLPSLSCRFRGLSFPGHVAPMAQHPRPRLPPRMDVPRRGSTVSRPIRS
jgi:hypothetical protein